jgi:UDP-N-acetylglucosamine diphosphorylase/glucosamine-1-phosphate N-acetyltransferase
MAHWILFESSDYQHLLPLTHTRPVFDLRIGIDLIREKWEAFMGNQPRYLSRPEFTQYPRPELNTQDAIFVNSAFIPDAELVQAILHLSPETVLKSTSGHVIGARTATANCLHDLIFPDFSGLQEKVYQGETLLIALPSDLFRLNGAVIRKDFDRITKGRLSSRIEDPHTIVYKPEQVFVEPGAKIKAAILNAENGPIYIGRDAEIQEGAIIHGAHAICDHAVVNMGAKLRGDSTIGPWCKVGGEVSNSILHSYSNKGHDGFIGNSVIGAWCNLGADTNCSNLKNNYADVKIWSYAQKRFVNTGLMFCGLIMGDHSKCGINTMFNTGTVVGVAANIFGDGFPRNFIPDFSWGGAAGFVTHAPVKAFETAEKVMQRRGILLSDADKDLLQHVFNLTIEYRNAN